MIFNMCNGNGSVKVQRIEGTCGVSEEVNCGFKPDFISFVGTHQRNGQVGFPESLFLEGNLRQDVYDDFEYDISASISLLMNDLVNNTSDFLYGDFTIYVKATESGFSLKPYSINSGNYYIYGDNPLSYIAIKYTS